MNADIKSFTLPCPWCYRVLIRMKFVLIECNALAAAQHFFFLIPFFSRQSVLIDAPTGKCHPRGSLTESSVPTLSRCLACGGGVWCPGPSTKCLNPPCFIFSSVGMSSFMRCWRGRSPGLWPTDTFKTPEPSHIHYILIFRDEWIIPIISFLQNIVIT